MNDKTKKTQHNLKKIIIIKNNKWSVNGRQAQKKEGIM